MAPSPPPMSMSPDGALFAISSLDGQLSLWDATIGEFNGHYTPSAHLSATCSCLSWPPASRAVKQSKPIKNTQKRQKLDTNDAQILIDKLGLLAMGTENGTVLIYSCHQNRLQRELKEGGHVGRVNDIAWLASSDSLFTAGEDKCVIEWRVTEKGVKCKHQLDRQPINAIAALDNQNLLTASHAIKWWHWPTGQLLKTFNGHASEVSSLRPIFFDDCDHLPLPPVHLVNGGLNGNGKINGNHPNDNEEMDSPFYFLSSAKSDRYICAWDLTSKHSNSMANFTMDDEAMNIQMAYTSSTKIAYILAISRTGTLYIFEHLFGDNVNGKTKLNGTIALALAVVPRMRIDVALHLKKDQKKEGDLMTLPFLGAYMATDELASEVIERDLVTIVVAYGLQERPTFESLNYEKLVKINDEQGGKLIITSTEAVLGRTKPKLVEQTSHQKIQRMPAAKSEAKTTVIGPASLMPGLVFLNGEKKIKVAEENMEVDGDDNNNVDKTSTPSKKRRHCDSKKKVQEEMKPEGEMTFEEKLAQIEAKTAEASVGGSKRKSLSSSVLSAPKSSSSAATDSLVNVLVQGLQSGDRVMLDTILLDTKDEKVLANTARKLPVDMVPALLRELQLGLYRPGKHHMRYLKWIGFVLKTKMSYLMSMPNLDKEFLSLNTLLQSRTAILDRCYQLKGKLDIILEQAQATKRHEMLHLMKPNVTYESDSSSDDEDDEDDEEEDEEGEVRSDDDKSTDDFDLMKDDGDDEDDDDDSEDDDGEANDTQEFDAEVEDSDDDDEE